jgi:putative MATE family efflux protein
MKDLTRGPIGGLVIAMAAPIAFGMLFQTLYFFIDLYFVAKLGDAAIAGVGSAGNATFIIMALTQVLGVGAVALISQAVGRKDQPTANLIFNQSLLLSAVFGLLTLIGCYTLSEGYVGTVAADAETTRLGVTYLYWYAPGLALQFALVAMASALRATGIVKPTMLVQMLTVVLNAALAPVLIAGWLTQRPMGVAGAGLATSIAVAVGVFALWIYYARTEKYVRFHAEQWQPRLAEWKHLLEVGLPAGGEFALLFVYAAVTYWVIRPFGAAAQAGFGIGTRIMQGVFVPALAIAFAAAPITGQNFGAGLAARVRQTFAKTLLIISVVRLVLTIVCQARPELLISFFSRDPAAVQVGTMFLRIVSLNFVTQGLIFTCSNMFQGLGNTVPSLMSSALRIVTYALPAMWLSRQPGFRIEHAWYLSVATVLMQALISALLLRRELRDKLGPLETGDLAAS